LWRNSTSKNPDDVVITLAIRTPLTKGKKGGLKDTPLDGMVFKLLEQVVRKMNMDPALVEDVCLGNVRDTVYKSTTNKILTMYRYLMQKLHTTSARLCSRLVSLTPPVRRQ
jgi:acetyl-CoA acetyltransferase